MHGQNLHVRPSTILLGGGDEMGGRTRYLYQYVMHESSFVIILRIRTLESRVSPRPATYCIPFVKLSTRTFNRTEALDVGAVLLPDGFTRTSTVQSVASVHLSVYEYS